MLLSTLLGASALLSPVPDPQVREPDIIVTAKADPDDPAIVAEARERLSRTPGAVAVVANEAVEDRLVIGMPDLLRDVPGVLSNKRYGEEARLSIRGSGLDQSFHQRGVLIAQDGVPFADADGFGDFQKIDPLGARYIEVYKGGNALRFGGAQLGGAINIVTPTGVTVQSPFLLRLEGGSFDTFRANAAAGGEVGSVDLYGSFNAFHSGGYRENSGLDQLRGTLNLGYRFGDENEVRLIGYAADIEQQVPGTLSLEDALNNPRTASVAARNGRWARDQQVERVSLQTKLKLAEGVRLTGGVYGTWTDLRHPIPIVIEQDNATQGAFGRLDVDGMIAGKRADLFVGAFYRQGGNDQQIYANSGGQNGARIGDVQQDATGLDVFAEGRLFVLDSLAIVGGGSWGRATRDFTNRRADGGDDAAFDWLAPRVGLLFEHGETQVYANVTRSVEPPHYGALAQSGFSGTAFVPVEPQAAWTGEIGTRGRAGPVTFDIAYFRSRIDGELLSFVVTPDIPASVFNADRTLHQGVEASIDWRIVDRPDFGQLRLRQTYSWSDFRFDGDPVYRDNRLPVVPEHQYRAGLRYQHASGHFIEPLIDWRMRDVFVDYANTLRAPGYVLLGLNAGIELSSTATLFVDARNLTDTRYAAEFGAVPNAVAALPTTFYPGEGRSVFAGFRFRL